MKSIIFDFDGVLADSFSVYYNLNKAAMDSIGLFFSKKIFRGLFDGNIHGGLRSFIGDDEKYTRYLKFRHKNFGKFYSKTILFPGTAWAIRKLSKKYTLAIASSTLAIKIKEILKRHKLLGCFNIIFGTGDFTKKAILKKALGHMKSEIKETVMVTDTTGDIKVAKELGLNTIAVSWGFQSYSKLKKSNPDSIARNFKEFILKAETDL